MPYADSFPDFAAPGRFLGFLAKRPAQGQVKTRLAAETSPAWAVQAADAFLHDSLARFSAFQANRILAFSPSEEYAYFERLAGGQFELLPQAEGHLGTRMAALFNACLARGSSRVVLLGSDSPTVPRQVVDSAFDALEGADLVLGPATDGGYYLIGCAGSLPPIFAELSWGSSLVLAQTVARLQAGSSKLALLPPWYDVDTLDSWKMLVGHVLAMRYAGIDPEIPDTEKLVDEWLRENALEVVP